MPEPLRLANRLATMMARGGAIPVSLYMAYANAHYYATRDPLGAAGDFITAPEISQMFGEMIGLWAADMWLRAAPDVQPIWVELGPGRGTLSADALRAMARFGLAPDVHFIETSPVLRDMQAAAVPHARFHDDVARLPQDRPLIVIANEFFDALPIRQLVMTDAGWRERMVTHDGNGFCPVAGTVPMDQAVPAALRDQPVGAVLETSPASAAIAGDLARTIAAQGGAMLLIDYGYTATQSGETLQAMARHAYAEVFAHPGEHDLTAHVDFAALGAAMADAGALLAGPVTQGDFLSALGIAARAQSLATENPQRAQDIASEHERLTSPAAMGSLFKLLCAHSQSWPAPEGFAKVAA